jgi:L-alanine-DL-glutamate epimerase-like enolase superfamily enzyme
MSPIERIEVIPLRIPQDKGSDLDGSVDTVIVRIFDSEGRYGIGEADAPPETVKAFIEMPTAHLMSTNAGKVLIGADPVEVTALWESLYERTIYPGRRGLGIHALSAVDIALHDLAGKQLAIPAYKLMGGARRKTLRPYCTIWPGTVGERTLREVIDETFRHFDRALKLGFRAVKMEVVYDEHATDAQLVAAIKEGRKHLGPDILMALDFGYRWKHWADAKWVLDRIEDCDIFFAEAALQHDDLPGHAELARRSGIRICGAEFAATRFEVREWIEIGKVHVVQPDISRCGGLTEIRRIAEMAALYGVDVIPHAWKTGILAHCGRHFQAACPASPLFEFLSPGVYDSPLRRDLVRPEPAIRDGVMELPRGPGLGIELDESTVAKYRVA